MINKRFSDFLTTQNISTNYIEKIGSTNEWAKENLKNNDTELDVFLSDQQNEGKGRFDRTWTDNAKGGQIFSSWRFPISTPHLLYPSIVGSFIHEELKILVPNLELKIPNDLYFENKKVAGILCEMISRSNTNLLIVGLGVNVHTNPQLETAGHLDLTDDKEIQLFEALLRAMRKAKDFNRPQTTQRVEYLQKHAFVKNHEAILQIDEEFTITTQENTYSWSDI